MHEKRGTILQVAEEKTETEHYVNMTVRSGKLTLRLTIKEKHIVKLLYEFDAQTVKEIEGKQAIINLCGGFMYQATDIPLNGSNPTYVPYDLSS